MLYSPHRFSFQSDVLGYLASFCTLFTKHDLFGLCFLELKTLVFCLFAVLCWEPGDLANFL